MEQKINSLEPVDGDKLYNSLNIIEKFKTKQSAYELLTGDKPSFLYNIRLFFANKTYSDIAKDYISNGKIEIKNKKINEDFGKEKSSLKDLDEKEMTSNANSNMKKEMEDFRNELKIKEKEETKITQNRLVGEKIRDDILDEFFVESDEYNEIDPDVQEVLNGIKESKQEKQVSIEELLNEVKKEFGLEDKDIEKILDEINKDYKLDDEKER